MCMDEFIVFHTISSHVETRVAHSPSKVGLHVHEPECIAKWVPIFSHIER